MKKILFESVIFIISLLVFSVNFKDAHADMGPDYPSCYDADSTTGKSTCGIMNLSVNVDVSSLTDRFIFIQVDTCNGSNYSVVENNILIWDIGRFNSTGFITVDKDYFQSNGGTNGIFNTKEVTPDNECGQTPDSKAYAMEPKDPAGFSLHSYDFIVSKDDENLYIDQDNLILAKYARYTGGIKGSYYDMAPKETPNLSCTLETCSEAVTYTPQSVIDNHILLTPTKVVYNPLNANKFAPYIPTKGNNGSNTQASSTQSQIQNNQNSTQNIVTPPNPDPTTSTPAVDQHVSWWTRMRRTIGNFFKNLFK